MTSRIVPQGLSNLPYFGSKLTSWGSSDATASSGVVTSALPQYTDPRYPLGKDDLPKATIDMEPEVLARLERFVGVDGDRIRQINAYSPSMGRTIPLVWVVPEDNTVPGPTVSHSVAAMADKVDRTGSPAPTLMS